MAATKKNYKVLRPFEFNGIQYNEGDTWPKPDYLDRDTDFENRNLRPKGKTGLAFAGERELAGVFERDDEGNPIELSPRVFKMATVGQRVILPLEE